MVLSERQIGEIRALWRRKVPAAQIAREVGVSRSTVARYVANGFRKVRYNSSKRTKNPKMAKRRRVLCKLASVMKKKGGRTWPAYGSAEKLRNGLLRQTGERLSVRQVRRCMKAYGMKPYVRQKIPTRHSGELRKRRLFLMKHKNIDVKRIAFSDETWLSTNEYTGKIQYAKKRADVQPLERKSRWNVPSVQVWAIIGWNYKGPMVLFPALMGEAGDVRPFRLNGKAYIRRCLSLCVPELKRRNLVLQQDGARAHVHKDVRRYLEGKKVPVLSDWPAQSPDLNMIEPLWKTLKQRVGEQCPMTQSELIEAAKKAWRELPQRIINSHVIHFQQKLDSI